MKQFKDLREQVLQYFFLNETTNPALRGVNNDDRGKMHEILTASHINKALSSKPNVDLHKDKSALATHLPPHYRNEEQKTPEQVHNEIKKRMSPQEYQHAHHLAAGAAEHYVSHLKDTGQHSVFKGGKAYWTSQASDPERHTGIKGDHGPADIVVSSPKKKNGEVQHHSISMKITGASRANVKNPGIADLAKHANTPELITQAKESHEKLAKMAGISHTEPLKVKKQKFKEMEASGHPKATKVREASIKERGKLAQTISGGMSKLSQPKLKEKMQHFAASTPTVVPHYRLETNPETGMHHIANPEHEFHTATSNYSHFSVEPHLGNRTSIHIRGHRSNGSSHIVQSLNLKHQSGPMTGVNATSTNAFKAK